jgi:hypothetical protein
VRLDEEHQKYENIIVEFFMGIKDKVKIEDPAMILILSYDKDYC